jgi:hypothetical protein
MKLNKSSFVVAFLLTVILVTYNNCGAEKAIQSSLDNYFAVLTNPVASTDTSQDPSVLSGTYYRAFYSGNGDVNYIEMSFEAQNKFNYKTVFFPAADYTKGEIDEKIGTFEENNGEVSIKYTQENCDPIKQEILSVSFSDATDLIKVTQNNSTFVFYNKSKYNLPQSILDQIGPLKTSVCQ